MSELSLHLPAFRHLVNMAAGVVASDQANLEQVSKPFEPSVEHLEALSGRDVAELSDVEVSIVRHFIPRSRLDGVFVAIVNTAPASEVQSAREANSSEALALLQASYPSIVVTSFRQLQEVMYGLGFMVLIDECPVSPTPREFLTPGFLMNPRDFVPKNADLTDRPVQVKHRIAGLANLPRNRRGSRWAR